MANSIITERKKREQAARAAEAIAVGKRVEAAIKGVDTHSPAMVQSGFSIFNQEPPKEMTMSEDTVDKKAQAQAQAAKKAEREAKAAAAQAEKDAKAAEKAKAKAEKEQAAEAAKKAKAAEAAKKAAEREAAEAALREKGLGYVGPMLALRTAKEHYVKGPGGRLHSGDPVATAFAALIPAGVVAICLKLLGMSTNKYAALNIGQQSMNLRNLVRGALKNGKLTPEAVIAAVEGAEASMTVAGVKAERAAANQTRLDELAAKRAEKQAAEKAEKERKAAERAAAKQAKTTEPEQAAA